jgi:hypothetical protein
LSLAAFAQGGDKVVLIPIDAAECSRPLTITMARIDNCRLPHDPGFSGSQKIHIVECCMKSAIALRQFLKTVERRMGK